MAFSYTTSSGQTMIIPDSSINVNVINNPTGSSTSGTMVLVGEADAGPSWSQDAALGNKLSLNSYSANDLSSVQQKYGTGRLVDAFAGSTSPSASSAIQGAPNAIILVKTNNSSPSFLTFPDNSGTTTAKLSGIGGNGIQESVITTTPESAPTTGNFSYIPSALTSIMLIRVNGGAAQTLAIAANEAPSAVAAALTNLANINAVGGVNRSALAGLSGQMISLAVTSTPNVAITLSSPTVFTNAPQVGDTLNIPAGSVLEGAGSVNVGWYLVTAVSNVSGASTISATMMGSAPAPIAVTPVAISGAPNADLIDYSYMQINDMSGTNRNVLTGLVGQLITITASGSTLTATLATGKVFAGIPTLNDWIYIPAGSAFAGAGNANVGWYQMTLISNTGASAFLQMSRLSNGSPVAVAPTAIAALTDIQDLDPQIKGLGKSMEIYNGAGATNINTEMLNLGVTTPATWLQTMLVSQAELQKTIVIQQNSSGSTSSFVVGGNIVMTVGYIGTTGTMTISMIGNVLTLTTSITGGPGANLNLNLSTISTLADLATIINSNPGYSAVVSSSLYAQQNPSILDEGTFNIDSSLGNQPARIKNDLQTLISSTPGLGGSALITYNPIAVAGLPADMGPTFLSGGAKGGTTGLQFSQAIDALQGVRTNFVVPLVSQDASLDIAANLTDPSSTYTVDAVNAAIKSHCIAMSTPTIKRNRIGIVSKRGTFVQAQQSAQNMSSFRIAHLFMDVKDFSASVGQIVQFQPWYGCAKAAAMQAAGSYKSIFNKNVNISGAIQAAGDYDDENVGQTEQALQAGLIPFQLQETGGWNFVSDQMTYSLDNNFVYNSLQAVYVADLMALDLAQSLKVAFVGDSVADVTPGTVESFIKAKMAQYLASKYTVATAQAPGGWVSISINIVPGVLLVNVIVVEATSIYFIPINLSIEGIQNSTTATGT